MTPLMLACARGYSDVVEVLMAAGADPYQEDLDHHDARYHAISIPVIRALQKRRGAHGGGTSP